MRQKNVPQEFAYGNQLKALFDEIYQGAKFAHDEGHFEVGRQYDALGNDGLYIKSGNDVYRSADKQKLILATEFIAVRGYVESYNKNFISESLGTKLDYYSKFNSQIKATIDEDPSAKGANVSSAFQEYGKHLYSQIDRFDLRSFSNKGFSNFKE